MSRRKDASAVFAVVLVPSAIGGMVRVAGILRSGHMLRFIVVMPVMIGNRIRRAVIDRVRRAVSWGIEFLRRLIVESDARSVHILVVIPLLVKHQMVG